MNRDELFRLFGGFSDGTLSDAEMERLQTALREDAEARRLWFLFNDVEMALGSVRAPANVVPLRRRDAWRWGSVAAAAAAVIVAGLFLLPQRGLAPVAVLSAATNARWSDSNVELSLRAGEMPRGLLRLENGLAEFRFASGATVIIEGPAVFEPRGPKRIFVQHGKVFCRCPDKASQITVVTPETEVTDLGTEFAVVAGAERNTRVAVIRGEVKVAASEPRRLKTGEAAEIGRDRILKIKPLPPGEIAELLSFNASAGKIPARKNRLRNAGFDVAGDGWGGSAGHFVPDARGRSGGAMRVRALGNRFWPLVEQTTTGDIGGRVVVASVWAMHSAADPLLELQSAILKINFVDEHDREFAYAERYFLHAKDQPNRYVQAQVAAVAPAGATRVKLQLLLNARGLNSGSVLFDDAALFITDSKQYP